MSRRAKWLASGLLVLALAVCTGVWATLNAERLINRVVGPAPPASSERAVTLHRASTVVDLHADTLLWNRDLLERSARGHVDLPRLRAGGVALQVFAAPTRTPVGMNVSRTPSGSPDMLTALVWLQGWPAPARGSLLGRAQFMASRLHTAASASDDTLRVVRSREDLTALLADRADRPELVGGLLALEGAHALEGDPANLDAAFEAGFRMIGLAHFFDNAFAGSAHGVDKGGLTKAGRALVRRMERAGVVLDLAHVSPRAVSDALSMATRPPVVSHGGVQGTCPGMRNLADDQVRAIAALGGVIGIGYWSTAVCGTSPAHVARAIRHVVELVGDDHVALGSDYDGAVTTAFDTSRLDAVTQALLDDGLPPASVRKILGANTLRVLLAVLPARQAPGLP